jgi:hypothetical protein
VSPSTSKNPDKGLIAPGSDPNSGTVNVGSGPSGSENGGSSSSETLTTSINPSDSSTQTPDANTISGGSATSSASGGAIAAVIILILLFSIAVVVFVLRKRSKARRDEQALKWGFTRNRTYQAYGDTESLNSRSSCRSSFVTTFDHSNASFLDATLPPLPPMAEVGRANGTAPSLILDTSDQQNRFSIGSANSDNSQFLVIHHRESLQPETWASVASCMETFPFPKPPPVDSASLKSRGSAATLKKEAPEILYVASPCGVQPTISVSEPRAPMQAIVLSNPFADDNPFDDPTSLLTPACATDVETVRRPFSPQLQDELQVNTGESVRIINIFDDGWAFVEKLPSIPNCEQGLIPLDCLRDPGPNVLLGGKRVSSQSARKP